jgi:predicted anti-sigma-YlaC factor YlaD
MECEEIVRLLSEYLDRQLDKEIEQSMEEHFRECSRCLSLLHTVEKTLSISRAINPRRRIPKKVERRIYYEIRIRYKK